MRIVSQRHRAVNVGQQIGDYEIIGVPFYVSDGKHSRQWAVATCKCGKTFAFNVQERSERKTCGCELRQPRPEQVTHGKSKTRLYTTWADMIQRCHNPNAGNYQRYGAKGILVCKEWRESFEAFNAWAMESGYTDTMTIDRKQSTGNYEPTNCQWLPKAENSRRSANERWANHRLTEAGI